MRYITVPEDIGLTNPGEEKVVRTEKFSTWLINRILSDPKFGKTTEYLFAAVGIKDAVEELNGERMLALETADWEKLKEVVEEPSVPYHPVIEMQLVSFLRAILEPAKKLPEDK